MKTFRLLLLLLFFGLSLAQAKEVKFIHITDVNLTPQNASALYKTIQEINSYKDIDFVVFGGNNIAKANIENLDTFMWLLKRVKNKHVCVLLGSSDVLSSSGIDKAYYLRRVAFARKLMHSFKPNHVFKKKGYVFIVMDGAKQYFLSSNGYYGKQELLWLDKKLKKYSSEPVIILQHFPILASNSQWLTTPKTDEYFEVLSRHNNVKMIVSGHYGKNSELEKDGIYHIITESYKKEGAYKIIQYDLDDNFLGTYLVK